MPRTDLKLVNEFSLVQGGLMHRLMCALQLVRNDSYRRMALVFVLLTWLPMFLLSVVLGLADNPAIRVSFLQDFATHARFLVALPLMILADGFLDPKARSTVGQFIRADLVTEGDRPRFCALLQRIEKWRNAITLELGLLLVAIIHTAFALSRQGWFSTEVSSWYAQNTPQGPMLTLPGRWLLLSLPVFAFFLYRWLLRLCVWTWFLYQVSRLELNLTPTHPDHTAGLAFVGKFHRQFGYILFANSAVASGMCANWILFGGETLVALKGTIAVYLMLVLGLFLSPLLLLTPVLLRAKTNGLASYGAFAVAYAQAFHGKWLQVGESSLAEHGPLLGTPDIQSLADMQNSFATVRDMGVVVINRQGMLAIAAAAIAPFLPLLLTVYPIDELVTRALKMLL